MFKYSRREHNRLETGNLPLSSDFLYVSKVSKFKNFEQTVAELEKLPKRHKNQCRPSICKEKPPAWKANGGNFTAEMFLSHEISKVLELSEAP